MSDNQPTRSWGQNSHTVRGGQWKPMYASQMDEGRAEAERRYPNTTTDRKA